MDRNKLDPSLAAILQSYYDPRLEMDAADQGTQNVLALMSSRHASKEREPYEALSRLLTTLIAPAAAAHRAASNSNLPRAINYHNRLEQKQGNGMVNPVTKPFLSPFLAAMAPSVARALRREEPTGGDRAASLVGRALDKSEKTTNLFEPHITDTARILNQLNQMSSRAPKYRSLYSLADYLSQNEDSPPQD
jgi:hypothetical protein